MRFSPLDALIVRSIPRIASGWGVLALVREARSMMASGVPRHDVVGGSRRPGREDRRYGENSALHDSGAVGAGGALLEGKGRTPNRGERRRSGAFPAIPGSPDRYPGQSH